MRQTGHRSVQMVRRYIREGSLFHDNAGAKLGLWGLAAGIPNRWEFEDEGLHGNLSSKCQRIGCWNESVRDAGCSAFSHCGD